MPKSYRLIPEIKANSVAAGADWGQEKFESRDLDSYGCQAPFGMAFLARLCHHTLLFRFSMTARCKLGWSFLTIFGSALLLGCSLHAALLGNNFEISGSGCRFPDLAYGTASRKYLVVWADYNVTRISGRIVTDDGVVSGNSFEISEAPFGGLYPAIAYNRVNDEFLVTWDSFGTNSIGEAREGIFGQRLRAADGALLGANFRIGSFAGGIRSTVAWSATNNLYLVAYFVPASTIEIYGQRVAGNGTLIGANFNISNDSIFSGYPAVTWASAGNQFLVTWDHETGNINGRRVDAATGAFLGSTIIITTGGAKDRSCVAYDSVNHRWLVQFNDNANPGFSYDQYGQLINTNGSLVGGLIPLAHTTAFEGDTQFGGDIAFVPLARRFFSSFGTDTGMGGQESFIDGTPTVRQVVLGTGYYTSLNNAADPLRNRFLTAWDGVVGTYRILGQLYAATINPVSNLIVTAQSSQNLLSWRNPNDGHFTGTMIRYRTDRYPAGPLDGLLVIDQINAPGSTDSFTHTNLTNWTTYYYSAFAHDIGSNYSVAAQAAGTPRPAVVTISSSDFSSGADGWTFATWQSGSLAPGTIAWDSAGNVLSTGSGASNNRDACTREGSIMTRAISTVGRSSIQVEYDVMARLNAPPTGSPSGTCNVLEGSLEDKLVVYYSTGGTNGPWNVAQVLSEGVELPTEWTRKFINLAAVVGVSNTANFALRFQWQFNSGADTGRIDNIHLLSGAVTALTPSIDLGVTSIERTVQAGQNLSSDVLHISNPGEGALNFTVSENVPWLSVSPATAISSGPDRPVTISYTTANLSPDDYQAEIQIASTNAANSPQTLVVNLHVIPPLCFWEPFAYYDGNLPTMGNINWSGSANELQVDNSTLKIVGGQGIFTATHPVSCAGSNGLIAVGIKVGKGVGTGDFFWNIAIDDPMSNNLARWYGGSSIARGRVGANITADMNLTGLDNWDDLYIKIDASANTSEFYFNGVSYGAISHGTTPANSIGSIRLERLDRLSAANDEIHFDNLTVGPLDPKPPRLNIASSGPSITLSWPAIRTGTKLESTPTLSPSITWTTITNGIVVTNGFNGHTTGATNSERFFRLRSP